MATRPPAPSSPPPPPSPGGGIGEFLKTQIGPLPLWIWLLAGAGVAGFVLIPKLLNKSSANSPSASDPTATDAGASNAQLASEGIDPLTGVPFSVESSINPNTGLPNYYNNYPTPTNPPTSTPPVTNPPPPGGKAEPPIIRNPGQKQEFAQNPIIRNPGPIFTPDRTFGGTKPPNPVEMVPRPASAPVYRVDSWR